MRPAFVLDHGIDGLAEVLPSREVGKHVLTWGKDHSGGGWWEGADTGCSPSRQRTRNHACDLRHYRFGCQEAPGRATRTCAASWNVPVRIACCNLFLGCLDVFRTFYDNRRNDHELLRALTLAPGSVTLRHETACVPLVPELAVQPRTFAAMRRFCEDVSAIVNRTWPGRASLVAIAVVNPPPGGP